jgi:hypothetical protein
MKRIKAILVIVFLSCSLFVACSGCGGQKDGSPSSDTGKTPVAMKDSTVNVVPKVKSIIPAKDMKNVAINEPISVTFSIEMDPASITEKSFFLKTKTAPVEGKVIYKDGVAVFRPKSNLSYGVTYTMIVKKSVKSQAGLPLEKDYVWNFETDPSFAPVMKVRTGTGPIYSDITGYDFNSQDLNTPSEPAVFTVRNEGTADLSIRSITLVSGDTDQFVISSPSMPSKLSPQQEMNFSARFKPLSSGLKSALVRIRSNDDNIGYFSFQVQGKGN